MVVRLVEAVAAVPSVAVVAGNHGGGGVVGDNLGGADLDIVQVVKRAGNEISRWSSLKLQQINYVETASSAHLGVVAHDGGAVRHLGAGLGTLGGDGFLRM